MIRFPKTEDWMTRQLSDSSSEPTMLKRGAEIYANMLSAMESEGSRSSESVSAAGSFGGLCRRWHAGLVQSITQDIIAKLQIDPSRLRIRELQQQVFQQAQASKDLRRYAVTIRNGGGRAAPMPDLPENLKRSSNLFFIQHKDDLKIAVQAALMKR